MNIKRFQTCRWGIPALLGLVVATSSLQGEETIETLATFTGPNGAYPGYLLQDKHGNFYGTTYTGGKYDKGTIFEVPLNQPLVTLFSFDGAHGANPLAGLVEGPDGNFYGTTHSGGPDDKGTVFSVTPDGTLKTIVAFNGVNGAYPESSLLVGFDGNFYGTTFVGGASDRGEIYSVTSRGILTELVTFDGINGTNPGALSLGTDGSFYGTTYNGGTHGLGTAFRYDPDIIYTGIYGLNPLGGLPALDHGNFYGTAYTGTKYQRGTIFVLTPQTGLPPLNNHGSPYILTPEDFGHVVTFNGPNGSDPDALGRSSDNHAYGANPGTNGTVTAFKYGPHPHFTSLVSFTGDNGANPQAGLSQLSDGNFYGTTHGGGKNDKGTIFSLSLQGVLSTVHFFNGTDGSNPNSGLIQWSDGYFYIERLWDNEWIKASTVQWSGVNFCGTTSTGGEHGNGTVFRITADGSITTLVAFTGTSGRQLGTIPNSLIAGNDGNLYGTTYYGGKDNKGTVFRLLLQLWPPPSAGENATAFSPIQSLNSP
jgi:uncharacterized repeat protein (TIGR03803 family)